MYGIGYILLGCMQSTERRGDSVLSYVRVPQPAPHTPLSAKVAELVYALDLGSSARKGVGVRVPPFAGYPLQGILSLRA